MFDLKQSFLTSSAAVLALMAIPLLSGRDVEQPSQASNVTMTAAMPVSVAAVIARPESADRAEVRPRVAGTIEKVSYQAGSVVRMGDLLFVIDPRPYEAEVARLEATLEGLKAKADLKRASCSRSFLFGFILRALSNSSETNLGLRSNWGQNLGVGPHNIVI